jgi:hypothetical protein
MLSRATVVSFVLALASCNPPTPMQPDDAGSDAFVAPADMGTDAGPPPHDFCAELMVPHIAFSSNAGGTHFGDLAGDFTVHTIDGETWVLRDRWTGCESYVFFANFPNYTDHLFTTPFDKLFTDGPRNVQYFFASDDPDPGTRMAFAQAQAAQLESGFQFQNTSTDDQTFWRTRFHFLTDQATAITGSVGPMLTQYIAYARTAAAGVDIGGGRGTAYPPLPAVFGIDRAQHFDAGDSLAQSVAATDNSILGMGAYLGHFYNYRVALETRLAGETSTMVVPLVDMTTTTRTFTVPITLPDMATMAGYDTLEVDAIVDCQAQNPFACSEWDRIADVNLCLDGAACTNYTEISRWITPYWRRGRQHYVMDASPMLALLRAGGAQTFFVELGPTWERATSWHAAVSLRFSHHGGVPNASTAVRAFTGGNFDATYNTSHTPFTFTPPTGTTRVELVTLLTGHGQDSTTQCSEWCDHRHTFTVNPGTAHPSVLPTIMHTGMPIGSPFGCAARATAGVIPGQLGNWEQERAYWCPGLAVQPIRADITSMVMIGMPNTLGYQASFGASAPPGGGNIDLSTYVVYYR